MCSSCQARQNCPASDLEHQVYGAVLHFCSPFRWGTSLEHPGSQCHSFSAACLVHTCPLCLWVRKPWEKPQHSTLSPVCLLCASCICSMKKSPLLLVDKCLSCSKGCFLPLHNRLTPLHDREHITIRHFGKKKELSDFKTCQRQMIAVKKIGVGSRNPEAVP